MRRWKSLFHSTGKGFWRRWLKRLAIFLVACWLSMALTLVALRWIDPPTTAMQTQRHLQAMIHGESYEKHYKFVPLSQISPDFQHAVVAGEDERFYVHHGFDWHAMELAAEGNMDGKKLRGGSTITQQLVKNIFFGSTRNYVRKAAEFTLVPVAELVLGKQRILELYLNVVEWGPGVYGADAACRYHYKISASRIGRQQSARIASLLPAPLTRKPEQMTRHSEIILKHMRQMGW